ncbi:MAG: hypothetical protein AAB481_00445 [Patescibacteria group bacterium]
MNTAIELCIVGASGTMGEAFTKRAQDVGLEGVYRLTRNDGNYSEAIQLGSVFLLCMKQREVLAWLSQYGQQLATENIVISLAALLGVGLLERVMANEDVRICRIMTTTGIAFGSETIAWTDDGKLTDEQMAWTGSKLSRLGNVEYLGARNDEGIDQYTFRACVPGWIADVCNTQLESLEEVFGFSNNDAQDAVDRALDVIVEQRKNALGYGEIRDKVMSKGGITEAGVSARAHDLDAALRTGSLAARDRASSLVKNLLQDLDLKI